MNIETYTHVYVYTSISQLELLSGIVLMYTFGFKNYQAYSGVVTGHRLYAFQYEFGDCVCVFNLRKPQNKCK